VGFAMGQYTALAALPLYKIHFLKTVKFEESKQLKFMNYENSKTSTLAMLIIIRKLTQC
jgi:hypothetical protein